eukprot:m.92949 g.92949  ORF g.92949 m.92949 type:complete len:65 (-) comp12992_c0_seq9:52-246(-)
MCLFLVPGVLNRIQRNYCLVADDMWYAVTDITCWNTLTAAQHRPIKPLPMMAAFFPSISTVCCC